MRLTDRRAGVAVATCSITLGLDAVRNPGKRVDMAAELGAPFPEPAVRKVSPIEFLRNIGLIGGLLSVIARDAD